MNLPNPDGPYTGDIMRDPATGEPRYIADFLDEVHTTVRMEELIRQAEEPKAESVPLPEAEIPARAKALLVLLSTAVQKWQGTPELTESGNLLSNYHQWVTDALTGTEVSYRVQVSRGTEEGTPITSGNVTINKIVDGQPWSREFIAQVHMRGDRTSIYYDDFPYHEEEAGQPERNTELAEARAKAMIAELPTTQAQAY